MADTAFFRRKKAAAVLKHGVLTRYARPFVAKVGSTSAGGRVVVLDGYAGEGRYEDGAEGSPIFFTRTAREVPPGRSLELVFVEKNKQRFERLQQILADEAGDVSYTVWQGEVTDHLDSALTIAEGVPFLAFLDPCGVGVPFADLAWKIFGRPNYQYAPGTEVLLNFSALAVARIGGRLKEDEGTKGREATLARMDGACGGDWWRQVYLDSQTSEEAAELIADGFARRLREESGAGSWVIGVRNAPHQQPKYALVFLSRHPDGLYLFGEAVSGAQGDWRRAILPPDTLIDDEAFRASEKELEQQWIQAIASNIKQILELDGQFTISSRYALVMGETLGLAREKHVRAALKVLQESKLLASNCIGEKRLHSHRVVGA